MRPRPPEGAYSATRCIGSPSAAAATVSTTEPGAHAEVGSELRARPVRVIGLALGEGWLRLGLGYAHGNQG